MKAVEFLALQDASPAGSLGGAAIPIDELDDLAAAVARTLHVSCHVRAEPIDISFAFDPARRQYHSTTVLSKLQRMNPEDTRRLGVTGLDFYVPVLTFVFGEAQIPGRCAVISAHRLREEFYGLPPNPRLLRERLTKAALHELGHTFGLQHCSNWQCVMASTHAVERLDLKAAAYCRACRRFLDSSLG
jgi:archaemetzincin